MKFPQLKIDSLEEYVTPNNISKIIKERDIIFMCVDNHKSRSIISNYCKSLQNVTLISGGNELTDGNVQIYIRKDSTDLTPDLCKHHPEIEVPDDKLPTEKSCEELSKSEPQLYFTNLGVATIMCWAFYNIVIKKSCDKAEIYFDILSMNASSKVRSVK
jgi:molybdopterin/thiamine biosynthesis adenylyltransferase